MDNINNSDIEPDRDLEQNKGGLSFVFIARRTIASMPFTIEWALGTADEIIRSAASPIDAYSKAIKVLPSQIARRFTWAKDRGSCMSDLAHLHRICKRSRQVDVLDVENLVMGLATGTADIVYLRTDGTVVLTDFTADASLREVKMEALNRIVVLLSTIFADKFEAEVDVFVPVRLTRMRELSFITPCASGVEDFQFAYVDALHDTGFSGHTIGDAVALKAVNSVTETRGDAVVGASQVALGTVQSEWIENVITAAETRYPKTVKALKDIMAADLSFCRGMPPPSASSEPIGRSRSWAYALVICLRDCVDVCWSAGSFAVPYTGRPRKVGLVEAEGETDPDVILRALGGGFCTISVTDAAPKEWIDLVEREKEVQSRIDPKEIDKGCAISKYVMLEQKMTDMESKYATDYPCIIDKASKVLGTASLKGTLGEFGKMAGNREMTDASSCLAMKMLAVAREIAKVAQLSCARRGKCMFRITSSAGGRHMQITKSTGPLEMRSATTVLVAISGPATEEGSWLARVTEGIAESKALILRPSAADWYSEAPGKVMATYTAFLDTAITMESMDFVVAASLVALANRKPLNVALQMEKYYAVASVSLASDFDDLAKKLDVCTPLSGVEQVVLFRMVVRGLACALERDTKDLSRIVTKTNDGMKTIGYCPVFARGAKVTCTGIVNSFYDGVLSSGISSSHIRAVSRATEGAVEGTEIYESRKSAYYKVDGSKQGSRYDLGNQLSWCASRASVNAWLDGNLVNFVTTQEHLDAEVEYAIMVSESDEKYTLSLALLYTEALAMNVIGSIEDIAYQASVQSSAQILTAKKMMDGEKATTMPSTVPAYIGNMTPLIRLATGRADRKLQQADAERIDLFDYSYLDVSLSAMAVRCMEADPTFMVYVIEKTDSIEKPRDISLMTESWRPMQAFQEAIAYEIGRCTETSALKSGSKLAVTERALSILGKPTKKQCYLYTASDKSTYGPSKVPAQMYAARLAIGIPGELRWVTRDFFCRLTKKRMRPCDALMAADPAELSLCSDTIRNIVGRARRDPFWSIPLTVGMMQGLVQGNADLTTAASTAYLQRAMTLFVGKTVAYTTNDDGLAVSLIYKDNAWRTAEIVRLLVKRTGFATGEPPNTSKLEVSTVMSDLNTETTFNEMPVLPYVRTIQNCCGVSAEASMYSSALHVMNSTSKAIVEGAPYKCMIVALAMSWACHYERFRVIERAVVGDYPGKDVFKLGPPCFYPSVCFVYGPVAAGIAFNCDRGVGTISTGAAAVVSKTMCKLPGIDELLAWQDEDADPAAGGATSFTDYVMVSQPTVRAIRDTRLDVRSVGTGKLFRLLHSFAPTCISRTVKDSASVIKAACDVSPFKALSAVQAWAASSYAIENRRVAAITTSYENGVRSTRVVKLTWDQTLARIAAEEPADFENLGNRMKGLDVSSVLITKAEEAMAAIVSCRGVFGITSKPRSQTLRVYETAEEVPSQSRVLSYAHRISDDRVKSGVAMLALVKGVAIVNADYDESDVTEAECLEAVEAASRLLSTIAGKGVQRIVCSTSAAVVPVGQLAATIVMMNLGYSYSSSTMPMTASKSSSSTAESGGFVEVRRESAKHAMDGMINALENREYPVCSGVMQVARITSRYMVKATAAHPPSVADMSSNELMATLGSLATSRGTVLMDVNFMAMLKRSYCPGILRKLSHGIAVASERRMVIQRNGIGIDYVGCRIRTNSGLSYKHSMNVFIVGTTEGVTYARGNAEPKPFEQGGRNLVGTDMEIKIIPVNAVYFRYAGYPTFISAVLDGVDVPVMEVRAFDFSKVAVTDVSIKETASATSRDITSSDGVKILATLITGHTNSDLASLKSIASAAIGVGFLEALSLWITEVITLLAASKIWKSSCSARVLVSASKAVMARGLVRKTIEVAHALGCGRADQSERDVYGAIIQGCFDGPSMRRVLDEMTDQTAVVHADVEVDEEETDNSEKTIAEMMAEFDLMVPDEDEEMGAAVDDALGLASGWQDHTEDELGLATVGHGDFMTIAEEEDNRTYGFTTSRKALMLKVVPKECLHAMVAYTLGLCTMQVDARVKDKVGYLALSPNELLRFSNGDDGVLASYAIARPAIWVGLIEASSLSPMLGTFREGTIKRYAPVGEVTLVTWDGFQASTEVLSEGEIMAMMTPTNVGSVVSAAVKSIADGVKRYTYHDIMTSDVWKIE